MQFLSFRPSNRRKLANSESLRTWLRLHVKACAQEKIVIVQANNRIKFWGLGGLISSTNGRSKWL